MRMITKGRLAVTAMIDLALCSSNGPVALTAISRRQKISASYLDQLFGKLRKKGLVESSRGPGGGYSLARDAGSISVADIIAAVDDLIDDAVPANLCEPARSQSVGACASDIWRVLNVQMVEFLELISLKTLVDKQRANGVAIGEVPLRRGISREPVVKPIKTTAPNSIFALGDALMRQSERS